MQTVKLAAVTLAVFAGGAAPVLAAPLAVINYAMPNGDGVASGGNFNYWDLAYSGVGATTVDHAPLSGGTGDLTDGVVAGSDWFNVENAAGTGPYVGWRDGFTPNPTVVLNFAGAPTVTGIDIHVDNSNIGGVFSPASILINGVATPFVGPADGSIGLISFTGLNLTGPSVSLQFTYECAGCWVFVSEVSFEGVGSVVPEPATWALMIGGFGIVGAAARRRQAITAA